MEYKHGNEIHWPTFNMAVINNRLSINCCDAHANVLQARRCLSVRVSEKSGIEYIPCFETTTRSPGVLVLLTHREAPSA